MRCYLVRHAQTTWNFENRIQGHADQPLSPLGFEQAKRVGAFFIGRRLQALYTSHLKRSRQTADAIAHHTGMRPATLQALAEIHLGEWEGLTAEEVNARYAQAYEVWRTSPSKVEIPGAEPVERFRVRVREAFLRIAHAHQDGEVVVVSHGGVIAALLADWLRADYDELLHRLTLDNAGVSAVDMHHGRPCVLWVNATSHLAALNGAAAGITT